jgi:glutathione S-transferase
VILEFIADIFPETGLLPKDPVARARARFFISTVATKYMPAIVNVLEGVGPHPVQTLLSTLEEVQRLLPPLEQGKFVVGDQITIADCAFAPQIGRLVMILANDYGLYAEGEGLKGCEEWLTSPKFARMRQYLQDIEERESYRKTFHEVWSISARKLT